MKKRVDIEISEAEEPRKNRFEIVKGSKNKTPLFLLSFIVIGLFIAAVTVTVMKSIKTGEPIFQKSGEITFDDSLTEEEKEFLNNVFENQKLKNDLKISAETATNFEQTDNNILYSVNVPVVDFYDSEINITTAEFKKLKIKATSTEPETIQSENTAASESTGPYLIPFKNLDESVRLVSVDDEYYLDTFTSGAEFRYFILDGNNTEEVKNLLAEHLEKFPNKDNTLSFAQTGVTALTRAMNYKLKGNNGAYFAEEIKDFLSSKDLTHISNEVSFYDPCPASTGTMSLCADWRSLDSITAIGTDIVELSGNHNNNYGKNANLETIKKYHDLGMSTVGGGETEEKAAIPLRIMDAKNLENTKDPESDSTENSETDSTDSGSTSDYNYRTNTKGTNFTFLAFNYSTSSKANGELASGNNPGANGWDAALAKQQIAEAKSRGDIVIVDVQYSECYSYPDGYVEMPACDYPISGQQTFFRNLIDLGADMVVGTQAHHPQTFELYKNKPIFYGLGNLFFDQKYWPGTERGLILTHYFVDGKLVNTRVNPTVYHEEYQVHLMDEADAEKFLNRLINASAKGE